MKVTTISVGSTDYDLAIHPSKNEKSPIFVYLNQQGNGAMGSYVYTIGATKNTASRLSANDMPTYSSVIQGDGGGLQDLAANLGRVLTKKFGCPAYVSISGAVSLTDYGFLSREIVAACNTADETSD